MISKSDDAPPPNGGLRLKIGVMGGAGADIPPECLAKAEAVGTEIASHGCVLITGACPGLPLAAARGAKRIGGVVVGISPALSLDEHAYKYESPTACHDVLVFTGSGLMGREVVNIRTSDMIVIIGGASGTLGELAIAYDEGKLIGVLQGTGGISDLAVNILAACNKHTGARVLYEHDPAMLVRNLLEVYRKEHWRRPSCFCRVCDGPNQVEPAATAERDIVCGMWVDPNRAAARRTVGDVRYYFCSPACAERFDEDHYKFLKRDEKP